MPDTPAEAPPAAPDAYSVETSLENLRGIEETLFCIRDACDHNGVRENKPLGRALDFLAYALGKNLEVIERHLGFAQETE
jgi:hypothetical protein